MPAKTVIKSTYLPQTKCSPQLLEKVKKAAALQGENVAEFIRTAIDRRIVAKN